MSNFKPKFLKPSEVSSYLDKNENNLGGEFTNFVYNKNYSLAIEAQRQQLPIYSYRNHILYLLENYQTLVLVGETGCGKSTQIPQYMIEAGWPDTIAVTESRRIAAISLADRVAQETNTLVQHDFVGYSVRFDTCNVQPKIKYMTEGILIREMMCDPLLQSYSAIMIDEVHERTLYTDILMGLLKKILRKRKSLRLIVASATIDADKFRDYFNNNTNKNKSKDTAVIMSIEGRLYPVNIYYIEEPVPDYIQATVDTALKIHRTEQTGDILAFLTGQDEVERAVRLLHDAHEFQEQDAQNRKLLVLPMYGALPNQEQLKVFRGAPKGTRKIVVSTNIAETSITIPGIVYVIDCGYVKLRWFNAKTYTDNLVVVPVSKSSAEQRSGRAGRMKPGKTYRLYTEEAYSDLSANTVPEIQRSDLSNIVLQLKALGIDNILRFKWLDPPPAAHLWSTLELLYALHALDDSGNLTVPLGCNMAEFVLEPVYSKILLTSEQVFDGIALPRSAMSFLSSIQVKNSYQAECPYCDRFYLDIDFLLPHNTRNLDIICKCLTAGLFPNAAYLHHTGVYKTVRGDENLYIHPDSLLYTLEQPQWVTFCEILHTSKTYMRNLTVINSEWLLEVAPHFYHKVTEYKH